jgi:predicted ATPase
MLYFKDERVNYAAHYQEERSRLVPLGSGGKATRLVQISNDDNEYKKYMTTISNIRNYLRNIRFYQFHDTTPEAFIRKATHRENDSYLRSNGANLGTFLFMLSDRYPKTFETIQNTVRQIAPFIKELLLENEYNPEFVKLRWREHKQAGYYFDTAQFSDGTLRAIALVTALLQPILPTVMCIDEPELGLHPEAIAILADLIKDASERCQILIATQSPTLIDHFEAEDIVVVNKRNGETQFERLSYERYKDWLSEYSLSATWNTNIFGGRPQR